MTEQNLLILAYEKPISVNKLSEKLGIATAFVEDAVDKLIANEFIKREGSKIFTNFPIIDEEFMDNIHKEQKKYVDATFDVAHVIFMDLINNYKKLNLFSQFNDVQLYLYTIITFHHFIINHLRNILSLPNQDEYPDRPNGGKWLISFGYKSNESKTEIIKAIQRFQDVFITSNSYEVVLIIYDTAFGGSPCGLDKYIDLKAVGELLYFISKEEKYQHLRTYLIPALEEVKYVTEHKDGVLKSNIPIITHEDYEKINQYNIDFVTKYIEVLGDQLLKMIKTNVINYPKQIKQVTYSTQLISMSGLAITHVEKAIEEGIIKIEENVKYPVAILIEKPVET